MSQPKKTIKRKALPKLLFIDTNIWLDFYRAKNDAALSILKRIEGLSERIIVTYQLEVEFKKNRQAAILEGLQELKAPTQISRPGVFSDAKSVEMIAKSIKDADQRVKSLRAKLVKTLEKPTSHDPVFQACQRIFHRDSNLVLTREDPHKQQIRRRAFRRFLHGCPPRKKSDTSFGDGFNWEWMIECAKRESAELIIVSRDADFGVTFDNKAYINDHLKQEFQERVAKNRKLLLYTRVSEALKHFAIPVTQKEVEAETDIMLDANLELPRGSNVQRILDYFRNNIERSELQQGLEGYEE